MHTHTLKHTHIDSSCGIIKIKCFLLPTFRGCRAFISLQLAVGERVCVSVCVCVYAREYFISFHSATRALPAYYCLVAVVAWVAVSPLWRNFACPAILAGISGQHKTFRFPFFAIFFAFFLPLHSGKFKRLRLYAKLNLMPRARPSTNVLWHGQTK